MAKNYDNILDNILGQLQGFFDLNRYQSSVDQAVAAQEATARTGLQDRVRQNLAGRGIDPNSAYAQSMFTDLWAPMQSQFAGARAGAAADYYRSILSLAPTLLSLVQAQKASRNSGGDYGGFSGSLPAGVHLGTITNPEVLTTPHKPRFDIFADKEPTPFIEPVGNWGKGSGGTNYSSGYSSGWPSDFLYTEFPDPLDVGWLG